MSIRVTPISTKTPVFSATSKPSDNDVNLSALPNTWSLAVVTDAGRSNAAGVVKVFEMDGTKFCASNDLANAPSPWAKQKLG